MITLDDRRPLSAVQTAAAVTLAITTAVAIAILFAKGHPTLSAAFATTAGANLVTYIVVSNIKPAYDLPHGEKLPVMSAAKKRLLGLGFKETPAWEPALQGISQSLVSADTPKLRLLLTSLAWHLRQVPMAKLPPYIVYSRWTAWYLNQRLVEYGIEDKGVSVPLADMVNPLLQERQKYAQALVALADKIDALLVRASNKQAILDGLQSIISVGT